MSKAVGLYRTPVLLRGPIKMLPDEKAILLIELARIVHDRYQQVVEETVLRGGSNVPSYEELARDTLAELSKEVGS